MKQTNNSNYSFSVNQCFVHLQYDNQSLITRLRNSTQVMTFDGWMDHLMREMLDAFTDDWFRVRARASPCYTFHAVSARGTVLTFSAIRTILISFLAQWFFAFVFLDPNSPKDFRRFDLNIKYTSKYADNYRIRIVAGSY
jgi:hypothetical protein